MYILKRFLFYVSIFWAAITLNFILPRMMPGNAASSVIARARGQMPPQAIKALELAFGVNNHAPMIKQYLGYLWNTLRGNFGMSFTYFPEPVVQVIRSALPWTLFLIGSSTILGFLIGTVLGIYSGWKRDSILADGAPSLLFMILNSIPQFWVALVFLFVLSYKLGWFPIAHAYDISVPVTFSWQFIISVLYYAILPLLALVITSLGGWSIGMRNNLVSVLSEDYIMLAHMKGLPDRQIMMNYGARNAMLPQITGFALAIGGIVGGAVVVEVVFSYPGIGYALYQAVSNHDYPLMQTIFLIIVIAVLLANFLVDVLYSWLDPRVADV